MNIMMHGNQVDGNMWLMRALVLLLLQRKSVSLQHTIDKQSRKLIDKNDETDRHKTLVTTLDGSLAFT